ncbi:hypothetical protein N8I71_04620 [Roseibacterium sp. SDUM158016]|uniref:hypothetical protein n=1 Tax=Roseicyclus sediminis TaxID=2980997 RepID=UPI0021D26535|nr:hypothetical protein [Roseibacterium sp. SDUM158016]MCU4652100.1 hypothetical protein [Roseibacterium sp. SDUM158016]
MNEGSLPGIPDRLIMGTERTTARLEAEAVAAALRERGLGAGSRVAAARSSVADLVAVLRACARSGIDLAVMGPADPRPPEGFQPDLWIADTDHFGDAVTPGPPAASASAAALQAGRLIWSSAAGSPAGGASAGRSFQSIDSTAGAMAARLRLTSSDRVLVVAEAGRPLALLACLAAEAVGACWDAVPLTAWPDPAVCDILVISGACNADAVSLPSGVRLVVTDGPEALGRALRQRRPDLCVLNAWAAPGFGGLATLGDPGDPPEISGSTHGRRLPGVEIMIVDPASGLDLQVDEPGQVWLRHWSGAPGQGGPVPDRPDPVHRPDGFQPTGQFGHLDREGRLVLRSPAPSVA